MTWRRPGRLSTGLLAWVAGAATAVAVGVLALSLIGAGLADRALPPLTAIVSASPSAEVGEAPEAAPPSPAVVDRVLTVDAGTVVARCAGGQVYLVSWSPAQGYKADGVRRGPAVSARVKFESARHEYTLLVRCVAGVPQGTLVHDDEHR